MKLTIKKLADLAGITVRALHHYDQIGLLKPSQIGDNGYRYYDKEDIGLLQQIMFFRELEFGLEEIKSIITSPKFDTHKALEDHYKLLNLKQQKINKLMKTIKNTLNNQPNSNQFDGFTDYEMNQYKDEVKSHWGNTDAYKQSQERTKHWTKEDYKRLAEDGKKFTQILADAMDLPIQDTKVQELIDKHHQGIEVFYDCPIEMYRNLGKMYVDDPRFAAYYDKFRPGLAQFVCDAIQYYCDHKK